MKRLSVTVMLEKAIVTLSLEGGGHEAVCQQGRWAPEGCGLGVPHRLEKGTSVNENVGS